MPVTENRDVAIFYHDHPPSLAVERDPVLLLMGLGANHRMWDFQVPALVEAGFRVLRSDNRGVGRSAKPPGPYRIRDMADDAVAVLDHAGIERAHVVGISMGGMIAQDVAAFHGDRVSSLTLGATFARPAPEMDAIVADSNRTLGLPPDTDPLALDEAALRRLDIQALIRHLTMLVVSPSFFLQRGEWLASLADEWMASGMTFRHFLSQLGAVRGHDSTPYLGKVRARTHIIVGTGDRLIPPRCSDELAALIPGARLSRVEGGTHGFNAETPEIFNRLLLEFLSSSR